jgi:uncharacterized protein (TIGR03067 family)
MTHRLFALFLLPLLGAAAETCGDNANRELETLQGVWAVESLEHHGSPTFFGTRLEGRGEVRFTGDKMTLAHFHAPERPKGQAFYQPRFTVKLPPSRSPKAIDLIALNGPQKGKTAPGIYQLKGDVLRVCLAMEDGQRPAEFPGQAPEPKLEVVLPTENSMVTGVALSGDGKRVVTGSEDGTAVLWEAATGKNLRTLQGIGCNSVALSRDGKLVVTGTDDNRAILWEAATGKILQTFKGHTHHFVSGVALSGDGKLVATAASFDRTAILWDGATGKKLQTFKGPARGVSSVALSGDGKLVVTGSSDGTATVWEAATGKQLQILKGRTGGVRSVALSRDGKLVVAGFDDPGKTAILWEAATGKKLQTFQGHTSGVYSVALSGDGKHVVTGSYATATRWEAATGKKLQTFQGHTSVVKSVALSRDGNQVWTGSADGTTRLWDAGSGKELCALLSLDRGKDWLVVTPDGLFDGSKGAWKYVTYRAAGTRDLMKNNATRKKFHRPGLLGQLVKGEKPKPPAEFKSPRGPALLVLRLKRDTQVLEGGRPGVLSNVAFSPDGKSLACCDSGGDKAGDGGVVKLWDVDKRKVTATFGRRAHRVSAVAFSPDGKTLAAGGRDKGGAMTVRLWEVSTGQEKAALQGPPSDFCPVAFSPDGKTLAWGGAQAGKTGLTGGRADHLGVKLWDLSAGKEKAALKGHTGPVVSVAFSPDGKTLATAGGQFAPNGQPGAGEVKLWEVATGQRRAALKGRGKEPLGVVWSVAFSPDSKTLACGDVFGHVVLWDVRSGKRTATLQRPKRGGEEDRINSAYAVAFSPDGKTLAAGTVNGGKLWDVQSGKPVGTPVWPSASVWSVAFSPDGKTMASAGSRRVIGPGDRMEDDPVLRLWELIPSRKPDE